MTPAKLLDWSRHTTVILASGPSLTRADIDLAASAGATIAVNSTAFRAPWATVIYAGDFLWWKVFHSKVDKRVAWTCDRSAAERYKLNFVKGVNREGLSRGHWINVNGNAGAQALNLAFLFGSRRILLAGFDMRLGPNGEKHHHPDHPAPLTQAQCFTEWIKKFDPLAKDLKEAGCEVINCTDSALDCFPKSTLEKELCQPPT